MNELIFTIEQEDHGGYIACAEVTPNEHITTQGDTLEELRAMILDAIACHFFDDPTRRPQTARLHFVKDEILPLAG